MEVAGTSLPLRGRKIAVLMTDGVEEVEYVHPRAFLEGHGARMVTVAPPGGTRFVQTYRMTQPAAEYPVDLDLHDARPEDFDALLIPGGLASPVKLYVAEAATMFIRGFHSLKRPIGAVCHAPVALMVAGLLHGRRVTSWPTLRNALEQAGAEWVDAPLVIDGNLVTARGPGELPEFEKALLGLMASSPHDEPRPPR